MVLTTAWQINLVERNGYGTDYIVAMLVNPKGEKRELARCAITVPSYAEYGSIYLTCKADNSMIKDSYYKVNSLRFDYILPYPSHIDGILSKSFRDALKTLLDKKSLNYDSVQNQFGYIDLYVPKGNDKEVKYDFNA